MPSDVIKISMRLFRRENGIYYIQLSRSKKISLHTKDYALAKTFFRRIQKEYLQGKILPFEQASKIPLSQFIPTYLEYSEARKREATTRMDSLALRRLKDVLGNLFISSIKSHDVDKFISILKAEGVKSVSINAYLRHLKAAWSKAIEWGYTKDNPFKAKLLKTEKEIPVFLEIEEVKQLLNAINDQNFQRMIAFYALTGGRRKEVLDLDWVDIDLERKFVRYKAKTSKGRKDRIVPLHPVIISLFKDIPKERVGKVFKHYHPDTISKKFKKALKKAGINKDIRLHDLRHTFASLLAMHGANTRTLQELLGHSDSRMVEIYTHFTIDHLRKAINSLDIDFAPKKHPGG